MEKNALDWIALVLVIIGGLNWGLFGLFSFDLVKTLFGSIAWLAKLVYVLVGLSTQFLRGRVIKRVVWEYVGIGVAILLISFFATPWTG